MKRWEMVKDKRRFNYIIKKGHYNKDKNFVVYYAPSEDENDIHFGIAIRRDIGHAVVRNKLKRQTRSIIDKNKKLFKKQRDYIIMIRNGCLGESFENLDKSLATILKGIK